MYATVVGNNFICKSIDGRNSENSKSSFVANRGENHVTVCEVEDEINKAITTIKKIRKTELNSSVAVICLRQNNELAMIVIQQKVD